MWLHENGYHRLTGQDWFCQIGHFHRWYKAKGFDNGSLERRHVDQYVKECPTFKHIHGEMHNVKGQKSLFPVFLRLLEERRFGRIGTSVTVTPSPLDGFRTHLREHCGLSEGASLNTCGGSENSTSSRSNRRMRRGGHWMLEP